MSRPPRIAYVSTYSYAGGAANDVRSCGVLEALGTLGCAVDVAGPPAADRAPAHGPLGRIFAVASAGGDLAPWLDGLAEQPDLVWLYGADIRFSARILRWARRRGVPVVCELVDWYELDDVSGLGPSAVLALTNAIAMPWARRRAAGFVVASRELAGYVGRHGARVEVVPAVMPGVHADLALRPGDGVLRVGYVGSPGRRDGLTLQNLEAVAGAWEGPPMEIHVAGVDAPRPAWVEAPGVRVVHHGRVSREAAVALVAACDATVLQRPAERRFARAGFPSKVAESMVLGTAPVVNPTSDLAALLATGRDSILLDGDSADSLHRGLQQLLEGPVDRERVAAAGRELFSVETATERIAALLADVEVS